MPRISLLARPRCMARLLNFKSICTSVGRCNLPRNPASGTPFMRGNRWFSIVSAVAPDDVGRIPVSLGFLRVIPTDQMRALSRKLDAEALTGQFSRWMASKRWADVKQLFEFWIRALDASGNPNVPDVNLYNFYLQANLMVGASPAELIDLVERMDYYGISPNTASFNLVLKAMQQAGETKAAETLIERMILIGKKYKEALPDYESYDLIVCALLSNNQIDSAVKYIDLTLKSGYMLSMNAFIVSLQSCVNNGRLDTLVSIIERCKNMHQNRALCPPWHVCNYIADVAMQSDNGELTYYALEFMAKSTAERESSRPFVLSVGEGLVVSALATAGRTYDSKLLNFSWSVLKSLLCLKKVPAPESYLATICAHANLGNLKKAFITLHEFEAAHGTLVQVDEDGLFSPFYSLNPLVVACAKKGLATLDAVYYQLENLSQADPPIKSIASLNCIILCCANLWDVDRACWIFNAIEATFRLIPDIHSYNALMYASGKLRKRDDAVKLFQQLVVLGVKPNMTTYSVLVDSHLVMRDPKAALLVIDDMIRSGFEPSKEMLKKIRRRCIREMDYKSDAKVESMARQFQIRMGTEVRRDILFNIQYSMDHQEGVIEQF